MSESISSNSEPLQPFARLSNQVPIAALLDEVDEVICTAMPERFFGISQWYEDFAQVTDEDVRTLLEQAWRQQPSYSEA